MSLQSTDGIILKAAWKLLWTPGTNYYLPNVMKNGLKWKGINIPPLEGSSVQDLGPVSLYKDAALGYISLKMNNNKINGLPSISDRGLAYEDPTHTLTLSIGFGELIFGGKYEVESGGVVGCAIGTANGLLGGSHAAEMLAASNSNIDLAYQYRDKLSDPANPNGNKLVDTYYEQNDTINSIVLAQNDVVNGKKNPSNGFFKDAWLRYTTKGNDTAYYLKNTSNAAQNPDDTNTGFNDDNFNQHGFYLESVLTIEANAMAKLGDPRGAALYNSIFSNAGNSSLLSEAQSYNGNSINNFMGYVKEGGSESLAPKNLAATRLRKMTIYEEASEAAQASHKEWLDNNRHEEYAAAVTSFASTGYVSQITGSFADKFALPVITMTAKISNEANYLVVDITDLSATIPLLDIRLEPDNASPLNTKVQNVIANAGFMKTLIKTKVAAGMNSDTVKNYLSDRLNDAIKKIFG